jgi:hypothetical protein
MSSIPHFTDGETEAREEKGRAGLQGCGLNLGLLKHSCVSLHCGGNSEEQKRPLVAGNTFLVYTGLVMCVGVRRTFCAGMWVWCVLGEVTSHLLSSTFSFLLSHSAILASARTELSVQQTTSDLLL